MPEKETKQQKEKRIKNRLIEEMEGRLVSANKRKTEIQKDRGAQLETHQKDIDDLEVQLAGLKKLT